MRTISPPSFFPNTKYKLYQEGIYDDKKINVYINEEEDFAFLFPKPDFEYSRYFPRVKKLNLSSYKNNLNPIDQRFNKIKDTLENTPFSSFLEIGCGNG